MSASRILSVELGLTYRRCLEYPVTILSVMVLLCLVATSQLHKLKVDASSDTLVAENDPELVYFRKMSLTFADTPFLVLTYTPLRGELFTRHHLGVIRRLVNALSDVPGVAGVQSILDAPLLENPPTTIAELSKGYRTLENTEVDLLRAKTELVGSPLFAELLVSKDGGSTAIKIDLQSHTELAEARRLRSELQASGSSVDSEMQARVESKIQMLAEAAKSADERTLSEVRLLRREFASNASMHLGGVPMVASDMIGYIRADMMTFGLAILGLLAMALYLFFRRIRWVLFPLGSAAITILLMLGGLAVTGKAISVVSANFIALLAIFSISFAVHLATRYRELYETFKDDERQCTLAYETMRSKLVPCIYTALTTVVAFASLLTSDIVPVIDFGWMMCTGIGVSLLVTYSYFASVLVLLPKNESVESVERVPAITRILADVATRRPLLVLAGGAILGVVSLIGIQHVEVGNRLVEYFRSDTEIRQGLDFIDRELGGTVPLDIVLRFEPFEMLEAGTDDDFAFDAIEDSFPERYWFTPEKIRTVAQLQAYLDTQPHLGKSLSVANLERVARSFNHGEPLSYVLLTGLLQAVPDSVRMDLIDSYASPAAGLMRISARLKETAGDYDLERTITGIERYAVEELGIAPRDVHVTGVAVLFRDMLMQLLSSQLSTLGLVLAATLLMFAVMLRSLPLAIIGLLPNLLAALVIMAVMGFAGIPLDIMTITIAAIIVGIGVDDSIHYLHRYRAELQKGLTPLEAVRVTHRSIGRALYFTSLTIVAGFSVLLFSRFVPTIYFGWLAALAMIVALTANLTLIPALLIALRKTA